MASVQPKLDEFFGYVGSIATEVSRKSLLGTAVSYALSMQDDRMAYKRKNWLFTNTRKGGDVSCAMYPLAKTAIHNGLDVWAYRKRLFSELPHKKKKEGFAYSDYFPWPGKVPDWVREGKGSGKKKRKNGLGHGYYPPPTPFLLYVVIFYAYKKNMKFNSI